MAKFDALTIEPVWRKGRVIEGYDPNIIRKDACGAWIVKDKYGDYDNLYGWEIDHIYPISLGGGNDIINLRPMNCSNNRSKGDDFPSYIADVTSDGEKNVKKRKNLVVNEVLRNQLIEMYGK